MAVDDSWAGIAYLILHPQFLAQSLCWKRACLLWDPCSSLLCITLSNLQMIYPRITCPSASCSGRRRGQRAGQGASWPLSAWSSTTGNGCSCPQPPAPQDISSVPVPAIQPLLRGSGNAPPPLLPPTLGTFRVASLFSAAFSAHPIPL